jgi:hypothetical protein
VAQLAVFWSPSDLVIMARAAKLPIYDIYHQHIVSTDAHLEANLSVAYCTIKADAMEPVREDHWAHACFFRPLVEYHVAIFGKGGKWRK